MRPDFDRLQGFVSHSVRNRRCAPSSVSLWGVTVQGRNESGHVAGVADMFFLAAGLRRSDSSCVTGA
jgi:hypothetical protein